MEIKLLGSLIVLFIASCKAVELTFELEDNARQCFYENIKKNTKCILEFQVITGGHYDVDLVLEDPKGKILYNEQKKQYDSHQFTTELEGEYKYCFSNEFSTFSHKTVYFDFQVGDEAPLNKDIGAQQTALTQLETSAVTLHESLKVVIDYQTHHKLRESTGRSMAEYLNERVFYWSLGQAITIFIISIIQVVVLRRFFAEKRSNI